MLLIRWRDKAIGKTQVCIRWVFEQEVGVKSFIAVKLKENIVIFDWALREENSLKINRLPRVKDILEISSLHLSDNLNI
ncbi:hypothetical protein FRX31_005058 [Thalictrum thalictroides]|uniref:Uncharacterized protein n=1 Tax=Thalictrum thalictroides TaxID=46969 RepID=A0A7J6X919_THATH|nr:hypothetical protein FRX31_005058 [Thalictrum thalictroides]